MKRQRGYAATAAAAGAGLALLAASRVWAEGVRDLGALPASGRTGGDLVPWLPAVALVALAGAGAVLASHGIVRAMVGGVLVLCGLGMVGAGVYALAEGASVWWPALAGLGGLAVIDAGVLTVARGRSWPGMAARYERPAATASATPPAMWDALDRGEDPTR